MKPSLSRIKIALIALTVINIILIIGLLSVGSLVLGTKRTLEQHMDSNAQSDMNTFMSHTRLRYELGERGVIPTHDECVDLRLEHCGDGIDSADCHAAIGEFCFHSTLPNQGHITH